MRAETLIAAFVIAAGVLGIGQASAEPRPQFDASDKATIARHKLLSGLIDEDPWLVRRLLDHLQRGSISSSGRVLTQEEVRLIGVREEDNPDLLRIGTGNKVSLEWIALLRKARAEKDQLDAQSSQNRTAEGSLELIEMMRRAKAEKEISNTK